MSEEAKSAEGPEPITIRVRDQVRKQAKSSGNGSFRCCRWFGRTSAFIVQSSLVFADSPLCLLSIFTLQTGEETFFKIKKSTKMQKVFDTYAQRKGVQASSLRFLLDGERIEPTQTPKMLELDDQDQIDCMLEQTGGSC